jgi:tetratricopeptide (TPR) repeat protein
MLGHSLDAPDLGMLPEDERPVVARALAKDPAERWPDCRTFVRELADPGRVARRAGIAPAPPPRNRRSNRRAALAGLMALAGLLVCAGIPERPQDAERGLPHAEAMTTSAPREPQATPRKPLVVAGETIDVESRTSVTAAEENSERGVSRTAGVAQDFGSLENSLERHLTEAPQVEPEKNPAGYGGDLAAFAETGRINPTLAGSYCDRGRAFSRKGDYDQAIAAFSEALRLDPECASAYGARGHAYLWKGDYDRAIADYTAALRIDPHLAEVCYGRGLASYNKAAYAQAITDYTEALRLKPGYALAHNGRGLAYVARGENDRALADFAAALQADPKYAEAYNNRGCVYCQTRNWDQAAADFTRAVQLDETNREYARNRAFALDRKASPIVILGIPAASGSPSSLTAPKQHTR